jgi:hypothetical protein
VDDEWEEDARVLGLIELARQLSRTATDPFDLMEAIKAIRAAAGADDEVIVSAYRRTVVTGDDDGAGELLAAALKL